METSTKIIIGLVIVGGILIYIYKDDICTYLNFKSSGAEIEGIKNKVVNKSDFANDL